MRILAVALIVALVTVGGCKSELKYSLDHPTTKLEIPELKKPDWSMGPRTETENTVSCVYNLDKPYEEMVANVGNILGDWNREESYYSCVWTNARPAPGVISATVRVTPGVSTAGGTRVGSESHRTSYVTVNEQIR